MSEQSSEVPERPLDDINLRLAVDDLRDFSSTPESWDQNGRILSFAEILRLRGSAGFIVEALSSGRLVDSAPLLFALSSMVEDNEGLLDRVIGLRDRHTVAVEEATGRIAQLSQTALDATKENMAYEKGFGHVQEVITEACGYLRDIRVTDPENPLSEAIAILEGLLSYAPLSEQDEKFKSEQDSIQQTQGPTV